MKKSQHILLPAVLASLLTMACEHHTPHRDGPGVVPPVNERPSPTDPSRPFDPELADGVWRLTGPHLNLRYDRGGVMFVTGRSETVRVIDIDGATDAVFSHSGLRSDSIYSAPELTVGGGQVMLSEARMMGRDKSAVWIRLLSPDSTVRVLVVPPDR